MFTSSHLDVLFPVLSKQQVEYLSQHGTEIKLVAGEHLFTEGEPAEGFA